MDAGFSEGTSRNPSDIEASNQEFFHQIEIEKNERQIYRFDDTITKYA